MPRAKQATCRWADAISGLRFGSAVSGNELTTVTATVALAGDTMLGRKVAERLSVVSPAELFSDEIAAVTAEADLVVANLECCISERGERWPDPAKPFFFRAPPAAVEALAYLGVGAVTLANNHALDFGPTALLDTLEHLAAAGIACVGVGADLDAARQPVVLDAGGLRVGLVGAADHPADFAAGPGVPGIAYAALDRGVPGWLIDTIADADADVVVATPHWGPNMATLPVSHVRAAAPALIDAGARLVAGHSAHIFHGVQRLPGGAVLYNLGDFIDDYAIDRHLRNDLGLLWLVQLDTDGPVRLEAVPVALDYCHTRLADDAESAWITGRFQCACADLGTQVHVRGGRLAIELR